MMIMDLAPGSNQPKFCAKPEDTWVKTMKSCNNQAMPNQRWCDGAVKAGYCDLARINCWHFRLIVAHGCLGSCANSTTNGNNDFCPQ